MSFNVFCMSFSSVNGCIIPILHAVIGSNPELINFPEFTSNLVDTVSNKSSSFKFLSFFAYDTNFSAISSFIFDSLYRISF